MTFWLVNQKKGYEMDKKASCLYAPCNKRHRNMEEVRGGDIFFSNIGSKTIKAIGVIKGECDKSPMMPGEIPPVGYSQGDDICRVPVKYYEISPFPVDEINPQQGQYLQKMDPSIAESILEKASQRKENLPEEVRQKMVSEDTTCELVKLVTSTKNVILHGAPGTGKTYLAKKIAAKIVSDKSDKQYDQYDDLPADLKNRIEFVQFYPGYDYSNFVEGLRPQLSNKLSNGEMSFELVPGIFKKFVDKANKAANIEKSLDNYKSTPSQDVEEFARKCLIGHKFWTKASTGNTSRNNLFKVINIDEDRIIFDPSRNHPADEKVSLHTLLNGPTLNGPTGKSYDVNQQQKSYYLPMWEYLKEEAENESKSKYIFIIDEINRGDTSSIFGELFYAIDPENRGPKGTVTLQYSKDEFYIPENVLIIGTMNDIDRSVEPFDFAFRRRWIFKLIEPIKTQSSILNTFDEDLKNEIETRMDGLNNEIQKPDALGADYQIGAAYFLKLKDLSNDFNKLWEDSLGPLLKEYVYGMDNEVGLLKRFAEAYGYNPNDGGLQE